MPQTNVVVNMHDLDEMIANAVLEDAITTIKKQFNSMISKKDIPSQLSISVNLNLGDKCSTYTTFDFTNLDQVVSKTEAISKETLQSTED